MSNRGQEYYTREAKKRGLLARSYFKLEEIDQKYGVCKAGDSKVLDIGCAPGSRLQYLDIRYEKLGRDPQIIGFDLKESTIGSAHIHTYAQDITDIQAVTDIITLHDATSCDLIVSDMAPDTIGTADIDALRSIGLIEKTLWIYEKHLREGGRFVVKVFMGPGFDELLRDLKQQYGTSNVITYKPKSCRKKSKETYIVKRR